MLNYSGDELIIYGAGMVGKLVIQYMEIVGRKEEIRGIAVSESIGDTYFNGYKCASIKRFSRLAKNSCVLIATFPGTQADMKNCLVKYGFKNICVVDREMYQEMANVYISDYLSRQNLNGEYDLLYISSDNNKTSGAFLCLVDIAKDIKNKGLRPLVILPEYGNGQEILLEEKIDFTYIPSKSWLHRIDNREMTWQECNSIDNRIAIEKIKRMILSFKVKFVHINTTYTYVAAVAARELGVPVIWHLRENVFEQGYIYDNEQMFYDLINNSAQIVVVSDYIKKSYPNLIREKISVIYDGVDIEKFYKERNIFVTKKVNIVIVGALYPLKRQEDLLKAATILKHKGVEFEINIIGNGEASYVNQLQRLIRNNGLTKYINMLGRRDDVVKYYEKSDISVICSKSEAFGRVCVESQLSGCLVIGADVGATKELIEDQVTGYTYQCENYVELAEVILYAVSHPNIVRTIAKEGQKIARNVFKKEKVSNQIYDLYKRLEMVGDCETHFVSPQS